MDIKDLKVKIQEFSESRFGKEGDTKGCLIHLKEEVDELLESIEDGDTENEKGEWADCILLLLDAFRMRYGNWTSYNHLFQMAADKLDSIEDREWVKIGGRFIRKDKVEQYQKNMKYIIDSEADEIDGLAELIDKKKK